MLHQFPTVTLHSGGVRIFPAAQIQSLTCIEATEAIAAVSDNFECMNLEVEKIRHQINESQTT